MSTTTITLTSYDLATLLFFSLQFHTEGHTVYANGDAFAPERPTYVLGGYVRRGMVIRNIADVESILRDLSALIEEGVSEGATTLGWWKDEHGAIHFDAGTFHDVESTQLGTIYREAAARGEQAIGLFVGGTYSTSLYL